MFFKLKEAGIDVILVNAHEVKNISEKKTDEADAEWLMLLHTYGLLEASYQPDNEARQESRKSPSQTLAEGTGARKGARFLK